MARARLLKPGFFTNEHLAELPFEGRLLFAGLWTLADREGRLEDRPARIKAAVFPFEAVDVAGLLAALEAKGFIERYSGNAMALIQIAKFLDHQTPHHREPASTLPAPSTTPAPAATDISGSSRAVTGNGSSSVTGNGSYSAERSSTPPAMEFPVVGKGPKLWPLSIAQIEGWSKDYPNLDVWQEMREARAWTVANPGRRKTASGMSRFLVAWLNRSVDRRAAVDRRDQDRGSRDRRGGRTFDCLHGDCSNPQPCSTGMQCIQFHKGKTA